MFNSTTAAGHLVPGILRPIPRAVEILEKGGRVLDLGCGGGWAMRTLALAYPAARLTGYDLDEHALSLARRRLAQVPGTGTWNAATQSISREPRSTLS